MAQEQTATPSNSSAETTYELVVPGDPATKVVDYTYENGQMKLTLEADKPTPITLTAAPESTGRGSTGVGYAQSQVISDGRTSISIRSPNGVVWVATQESLQNGKFGFVRSSSSSFPIPGPWSASDARDAGIGAAGGTALISIGLAWKSAYGDSEDGERLA